MAEDGYDTGPFVSARPSSRSTPRSSQGLGRAVRRTLPPRRRSSSRYAAPPWRRSCSCTGSPKRGLGPAGGVAQRSSTSPLFPALALPPERSTARRSSFIFSARRVPARRAWEVARRLRSPSASRCSRAALGVALLLGARCSPGGCAGCVCALSAGLAVAPALFLLPPPAFLWWKLGDAFVLLLLPRRSAGAASWRRWGRSRAWWKGCARAPRDWREAIVPPATSDVVPTGLDPFSVAVVNVTNLASLLRALRRPSSSSSYRRLDSQLRGPTLRRQLALPLLASPALDRWPLLSLPRFGLVVFPFFLALAVIGRTPRAAHVHRRRELAWRSASPSCSGRCSSGWRRGERRRARRGAARASPASDPRRAAGGGPRASRQPSAS